MENPFEIIIERLDNIEKMLLELSKKEVLEHARSNSEDIMTVDQLAEYLTIAKQTIYGLCSAKDLPYFKRGKRVYFKRGEIDNWLKLGKRKSRDELQEEAAEFVRKHPRKF